MDFPVVDFNTADIQSRPRAGALVVKPACGSFE